MKVWIKGGLIGLLIGVVLSIIYYFVNYYFVFSITYWITFPLSFLYTCFLSLMQSFGVGLVQSVPLFYVVSLLLEGFLIGSFMGSFFEKSKNE